MFKQLFFIADKREYTTPIYTKILGRRIGYEECWCCFYEKAVYADTIEEAKALYKKRYLKDRFFISDVASCSDNFDWGEEKRQFIKNEYMQLNSTHSIKWLKKNMDCQDFKEWFFDNLDKDRLIEII